MKRGVTALVSFDDFKVTEGSPLYVQILRHIKRGIVAGTVRDGDELPSRRMLSALLGVNPNTVQKAYRMLEEEGLMQSHSGAKSLMQLDAGKVELVRAELTRGIAGELTSALRHMGLTLGEALKLIEKMWEDEGE